MSDEMKSDSSDTKSPFDWNAGGWFGGQLGSSAWILLASIVLLFKDAVLAGVCFGGFLFLNAFGLSLWRSRNKLAAYTAMQRFLLATTAIYALIVVFYNSRGIAPLQTPLGGIDATMPYWVIALPPVLMLWFFVREREGKRSQIASAPGQSVEATSEKAV